eukprot:TRINITY_DN15649_c0_g1_i2.p1 TRINITY_DN15649_c0_g1~~TRINITY_DN15649_c0_g1_i2.p1  ORF type:complete len:135 (+),score=29.19 TRINITY_DN15649_c0_g1_i2:320-724(+)
MFQSSLESFLETSTAPPGAPDGPTSEQETPLKRPSSPKSYSSFLLRTSLPIPLQQKLSFLRTCKRHACNKWKHVRINRNRLVHAGGSDSRRWIVPFVKENPSFKTMLSASTEGSLWVHDMQCRDVEENVFRTMD